MVILKVVKIEFSVLNPGLSLRFEVARYMQIIGKDLNSKEILLVQSAFVLFPMKVARGHTGSRTQPGNSWSLALSDFPVNPVGYQPHTPYSPLLDSISFTRHGISPLDNKLCSFTRLSFFHLNICVMKVTFEQTSIPFTGEKQFILLGASCSRKWVKLWEFEYPNPPIPHIIPTPILSSCPS